MKRYRKQITIVLAVVIALAMVICACIITSRNKKETPSSIFTQSDTDISDIVQQAQPTEEPTPNPTEAPTDVKVASIEYDYDESLEDYLNNINGDSKVKIEGSGQPWVYGTSNGKELTEILEEQGVEVIGNPVETQKYWFQAAQSPKYVYNVSQQFKVIPSIKYGVSISTVTSRHALMQGPNNTVVKICKSDNNKEETRKKLLENANFGYYDLVCDEQIPYNTDFELGVGLKDLDIYTEAGNQREITIADNGNQIYVDEQTHTFVGDCYYIEYYSNADMQYHSILVAEIDGDVYYALGRSEERATLKEITAVCIDRCLVI